METTEGADDGTVSPISGACYALTLDRDDLSTVPQARRYAVRCAPDHPRPDDIALVSSELAANACTHGCGEKYHFAVEPTDDGVWITTTNDTDGSVPNLHAPGWLAVHGRGLQLVARLGCLNYDRHGSVVEVIAFLPHQWSLPDDQT